MIQSNVNYTRAIRLSPWRKVALGTWKPAGDPTVYGILEFDAEPVLTFINDVNNRSGVRTTLTHFLTKALALTIAKHPSINCVKRFGRLYERKDVDIFLQVAADKTGEDLSGLTIRKADLLSVTDIASMMNAKSEAIRNKSDGSFKQMKGLFGLMPAFMAPILIKISEVLMYRLNIWSSLLGVPRDPFGSAMITNIGSLGLDTAFVPLVPYSRVPLILSLGQVAHRPWIIDGRIEVRNVVRICVTFDHRVIDGVHASHMVKTFSQFFSNPNLCDQP